LSSALETVRSYILTNDASAMPIFLELQMKLAAAHWLTLNTSTSTPYRATINQKCELSVVLAVMRSAFKWAWKDKQFNRAAMAALVGERSPT
ncbi:hypothetical protein TELCIR_18276, partial [Teladorsagia circumcincta]